MHHSTSELAVSSQTSWECLLRNSWLSSYFCNIPYCFTNFSFSFSNSLYKSRRNNSAIGIELLCCQSIYDPQKPDKETIGLICRLFFQAGNSLHKLKWITQLTSIVWALLSSKPFVTTIVDHLQKWKSIWEAVLYISVCTIFYLAQRKKKFNPVVGTKSDSSKWLPHLFIYSFFVC